MAGAVHPEAGGPADVAASSDAVSAASWARAVFHLDLTDLDPPEPMARILSRTELMDPGEVLLRFCRASRSF